MGCYRQHTDSGKAIKFFVHKFYFELSLIFNQVSMRIFYPVCFFLLFVLPFSQLNAQVPQLEGQPASEDELAVIQRGADLNDQGKYDQAIEQFNKVLVKNSACVQAMYEVANTYYASGDRKKAFEAAENGLKYHSKYSALFYVLEGGIEDDDGNPQKAIDLYKKAISVAPKFQSAYFNLGITLARLNRTEEALDNFKQSLLLRPGHPSSNLRIGNIFEMKNQKIPEFMAYMSFLYFANDDDKRIPDVLSKINKLSDGGPKNSSGGMNISLSTDSTEGDFMSAELMMGLSVASDLDRALDSLSDKKLSALEKEINKYEMIFKGISVCADGAGDHPHGFAMQFYGKYFNAMEKSGNIETFCHVIGRHIDQKETVEWFGNHKDQVKKYGDWEKDYFSK
jgi:tetratricopeptide (TPR) repeat protein